VRNSAWYLAPVIVLIAGLSLARGETAKTDASWNPWWLRVVIQAPVIKPLPTATVVPPSAPAASGVLPAPPPECATRPWQRGYELSLATHSAFPAPPSGR